MTKLKKRYRTIKSEREAAEYREYLEITKEIDNLIREMADEIVAEGLDTMTSRINDTILEEAEQEEAEIRAEIRLNQIKAQPTFAYVDNAKPSLGRYKGVGTLPQGCQTCGANHRPR
jgi:hypothetical protein